MIYSVWNYATRQYDYYQAGQHTATHAGAPPVRAGASALGATPEQAAWPLPAGAQRIGSGPYARGRVASLSGPLDSLGIPTWLLVAGGAFIAWRYFR